MKFLKSVLGRLDVYFAPRDKNFNSSPLFIIEQTIGLISLPSLKKKIDYLRDIGCHGITSYNRWNQILPQFFQKSMAWESQKRALEPLSLINL